MLSEMLDAVKEAEAEAEQILLSAKGEAADIVKAAQASATELKAQAKRDAEAYRTEREEALRKEEAETLQTAEEAAKNETSSYEKEANAHQGAIQDMLLDVFLSETGGD